MEKILQQKPLLSQAYGSIPQPMLNRLSLIGKALFGSYRWVLHVLFWGGYFAIAFLLSAEIMGWERALFRSCCSISLQILLVYLNFFLIERFLLKERPGWYLSALLLVWISVAGLRAWGGWYLLGETGLGFTPLSKVHFGAIFVSTFSILAVTSALKLLEDWVEQRVQTQELHAARLEADLRFLQSQVNPHFLFNMLNMVYAMAYTQSEDTAPTLLKLSGMMRYMLEASRKEKVSLSEEVDYLRNFITLQQHKRGKKQAVEFEVSGETHGIQIAPMLFIPFLENAFKHGNISYEEGSWVKGRLDLSPNAITLELSNSLGAKPVQKDPVGGVGLVNIRKRLDLLYPGQYELDTRQSSSEFSVRLHLILNSQAHD